jgi:hypothetical protein
VHGFLDGTKRYEEQRARADDLADRDAFRNAVVNPTAGPIRGWVDEKAAWQQQSRLGEENQVQYDTPLRHRDGRLVWVAANINNVNADAADGDVYVGTLRDITAERAFAARESAVLRLATAVSVANSMSEVLAITLDECRLALDVHRVVAAVWPTSGAEPTIQVAGQKGSSNWRHLDPNLREIFQQARRQLPLTVQPVEYPDAAGQSSGIVAVLTGSGDVALWMELRGIAPGRVRVDGDNDCARVHLTITDNGSWKPKSADPGVRGRGLLLIRAVSDWLEMECTPSGTTVDMSFNLSA